MTSVNPNADKIVVVMISVLFQKNVCLTDGTVYELLKRTNIPDIPCEGKSYFFDIDRAAEAKYGPAVTCVSSVKFDYRLMMYVARDKDLPRISKKKFGLLLQMGWIAAEMPSMNRKKK